MWGEGVEEEEEREEGAVFVPLERRGVWSLGVTRPVVGGLRRRSEGGR